MNKKIFLLLYTTTQKNKYLSNIAVFITNASKGFYILVYLFYAVILLNADRLMLVPYILIPAAALAAALSLRRLLKVPRPFKELEIESLIKHESVYSFPSNHAASACVIACAVYHISPPAGLGLLFLAFVTGVSRILTGVHYPLDVLAGWALGLVFGVFGFWMFGM